MIWHDLKDMENNMVWLNKRHEKIIWYGLKDMGNFMVWLGIHGK